MNTLGLGGRPRILIVVAARPNFMKAGPVLRALGDSAYVELVHTGQHYDPGMSDSFFSDLELPTPDVNLGIGSGTHAEQTAGVMLVFERHLESGPRPDAVIVVGDVNSTVAASLTSVKLGLPVAHVEAGLRSRDWSMPEEINRVVTDRLSRWLFTPSEDANENLRAEGVPDAWIHLVGNVMIDTLLANIESARGRFPGTADDLRLPDRFGIVTLHRPSNVDDAQLLGETLAVLADIAADVPLVFPVHPRTTERFAAFGIDIADGIYPVEPLGYLDFIGLLDRSTIVLTDSGGIQEEASVLGVPCLTLRGNTERPITCEMGTNVLVGTAPEAILSAAAKALGSEHQPANIPFWDGKAGERIANILLSDLIGV
jgi:UDP-N-acetylglucosamine 2-epimerase (non-hydrolysing)